MQVIGVQRAGASACNTESKTGYFAPEKCSSQALRVKRVLQQGGMKHKKRRVLPGGKLVSDTLCM
jgi:hypothetical protein